MAAVGHYGAIEVSEISKSKNRRARSIVPMAAVAAATMFLIVSAIAYWTPQTSGLLSIAYFVPFTSQGHLPVQVKQHALGSFLVQKHPSDYLEFDQAGYFAEGFPARPKPSWNPSDNLEFEQFAEGFPARPKPSWNPSDRLEFEQFAEGFPARPKPSWNPSDRLEFEQFAEGFPARPKPSWNPSDNLEFEQFAEGFPARPKPSWNPSDRLEFDQFAQGPP
ncbi:hypothetical protein GUITHDRAFT_104751 [Guillardia theta CCMP2712]|uniref:Uncharacterized protein n=1 Tax=Guillardia theta (strain CCMP2712) TaxID=905079 RepID=L1JP17_GUITC|nr:hypothetical protein GUITHDRAFT_104751 [Guillardia theta CCMP2712]EKX49788.1 hypothetical protein GUITHDRAFT_104751 [Guillardia theta CCMP2712]|eukprot:XP_005836768.1 hypothetical protein GUITHDRAFT_104751 [Guillardia theta CCMP2712]